MAFQKFTQAEKVTPATPQENAAANDEKQRTGSAHLSTLTPAKPVAKNCSCPTPCGMPCGNY